MSYFKVNFEPRLAPLAVGVSPSGNTIAVGAMRGVLDVKRSSAVAKLRYIQVKIFNQFSLESGFPLFKSFPFITQMLQDARRGFSVADRAKVILNSSALSSKTFFPTERF